MEAAGRLMSRVRGLFHQHLLLTNVGLSFGLSGVGDVIQQSIEQASTVVVICVLKQS
jgi:hypothetical protein